MAQRQRFVWRLRTERVSAVATRSDDYGGFSRKMGDMASAQNALGRVQFAQVAVDVETGIVRVERVVAAQGVCRRASVVLGAAVSVPYRAKKAEAALAGKQISEDAARSAAQAALAGAAPLSRNAYKLPIFEALVRRAILGATSGA